MKEQYVELGVIANTHGLRGEVKILPWTDDFQDFEKATRIQVGGRDMELTGVRFHKGMALATLAGIESVDQAIPLKGKVVTTTREELGTLPENTFYIEDLIGLTVYTDEGTLLGTLSAVFPTGANDVYAVQRPDKPDVLLPAIKQVVLKTDLANKTMTVHLLEGLVEDAD